MCCEQDRTIHNLLSGHDSALAIRVRRMGFILEAISDVDKNCDRVSTYVVFLKSSATKEDPVQRDISSDMH